VTTGRRRRFEGRFTFRQRLLKGLAAIPRDRERRFIESKTPTPDRTKKPCVHRSKHQTADPPYVPYP